MRKKVFLVLTVVSVLLICTSAFAQSEHTREYTVNFIYSSPPTMDGVLSAGEWDAAEPAQGNFRLLRTAAPGDLTAENITFQALCDADYLYVYVATDDADISGAGATAEDAVTLSDDLEIFWDPGDINENKAGDEEDDSYQLIIPFTSGTRAAGEAGPPYLMHGARYDALFGGLDWNPENVAIGINANPGDSVVEVAIPLGDMNESFGTHLNSATSEETDLTVTGSPADGDEWAFNICRINSESTNKYPMWNYHEGDAGYTSSYFAEKPFGKITFNVPPPPTATPTPAGFTAISLDWCLFE